MKTGKTQIIAFCGIMSAAGMVLMFLSGILPVMTYALPAMAGCILIPVVTEYGTKWAFMVYVITSIFSFFFTADKEAMAIYIVFLGYYPILYAVLGRIKSKVLRNIVKICIFNLAIILNFAFTSLVLSIPLQLFDDYGVIIIPILLVVLNIVFIIYDRALDGLIAYYIYKLRKHIIKNKN